MACVHLQVSEHAEMLEQLEMVKIVTEEDRKEDVASDTSSEVMLTVNVIEDDHESEETTGVDLITSTDETTSGY